MTDHETFLLLAAKQVGEPLTEEEERALAAHLSACPACRSLASGMRRDAAALQGQLLDVPVSPRVRRRVSEEAQGRRRVDWRLVLAVAAILLIPAIGVPLFAGARPSSPATPLAAASVHPPPAATPSVVLPSRSPSAPASGSYVAARYTYGEASPRRDTVAARFDSGPIGEWSRTVPATGVGNTYAGPITCLQISGTDAWLAGPATTVTDGTTDRAALIYVHDGGPNGHGDTALLWLTQRGQTLATVSSWCQDHYIPASPSPLTDGDVEVHDASR